MIDSSLLSLALVWFSGDILPSTIAQGVPIGIDSVEGSPLCSLGSRVLYTAEDVVNEPPRPLVDACRAAVVHDDDDDSNHGFWLPLVIPDLTMDFQKVNLQIKRDDGNDRAFPSIWLTDFFAVHPYTSHCSTIATGTSLGVPAIEYQATQSNSSLVDIPELRGTVSYGARYAAIYIQPQTAAIGTSTCADLEGFQFVFALTESPRIVDNFCVEPLPELNGQFALDAWDRPSNGHCETDVPFVGQARWYRLEPDRDIHLSIQAVVGSGGERNVYVGIMDYSFHRIAEAAAALPNTPGYGNDYCLWPIEEVKEQGADDGAQSTTSITIERQYTLKENGLYCIYAFSPLLNEEESSSYPENATSHRNRRPLT